MMRLLKITFAIIGLFSMLSCIREDPVKGADLQTGDIIPDFSVGMNDGTTVTAAQLRQGISVIVFFHTGCPDCAQTLPRVQKLYDEYASRNVRFALISREEQAETIDVFWKANALTVPYSAQSDRHIYNLFADSRIPRVYICLDGIIMTVFTDEPENPTLEDMESAIDALI